MVKKPSRVTLCLSAVRIQKGFSQEELARISGISRSYISEIEAGKKIPTIQIICTLSEALGVPPESLYKCEGK